MTSVDVPLRFGADDALRVTRLTYGMEARVEELPSYADRNFRLETAEGVYVLKIARLDERDEELDLQNQALLHLQQGQRPAPRPVLDELAFQQRKVQDRFQRRQRGVVTEGLQCTAHQRGVDIHGVGDRQRGVGGGCDPVLFAGLQIAPGHRARRGGLRCPAGMVGQRHTR